MKKEKENVITGMENTLLHNKLSFAATEAYKLLRTNLSFTLTERKDCYIIGVTSSIRGEGKSTTAINLSYAIAQTGKKVLVVDGDLRLPSVAKKMEMRGIPGLSNMIIGNSEEAESIRVFDKLDNWHILPAGDIPPNPTEMLGSSQMEKLIKEFSEKYDYIIIDLPPVNLVSDALVISHLLDGMIVVIREEYSERRELTNCIRQLELSGVKMLGAVMNVTTRATNAYGQYRKKRYNKYMSKYYKTSKYYKKAVNYSSTTGIDNK